MSEHDESSGLHGTKVHNMSKVIEQVQETYKRYSAEHSCEGLEIKTVFYGRPVTQEEIDRRRKDVTSFDYEK